MFKKILLATDGSKNSMDATKYAIGIAKTSGAELCALNALYTELSFKKSREDTLREQKAKGKEILAEVKEMADKAGIKATWVIVEGPPWIKIVEEADNGDYDLIVVGSEGKGVLLGSVAEKVVRDASCPVLVVKK
jgi:nucleotide-binding universal stress UspA family protein